MVQHLQNERKKLVLTKQILRSGTAIGAHIHEAEFGQSKADFVARLSISLKEANETLYWLSLLKDTGYIDDPQHESMERDCRELVAMMVSSIKTAKAIPPKTDNANAHAAFSLITFRFTLSSWKLIL